MRHRASLCSVQEIFGFRTSVHSSLLTKPLHPPWQTPHPRALPLILLPSPCLISISPRGDKQALTSLSIFLPFNCASRVEYCSQTRSKFHSLVSPTWIPIQTISLPRCRSCSQHLRQKKRVDMRPHHSWSCQLNKRKSFKCTNAMNALHSR